jgi:hypothetical protein
MREPVNERIKKLRVEIAEICKASQVYLHGRKYVAAIHQQERRLSRLQEIQDELTSMTDWKKS